MIQHKRFPISKQTLARVIAKCPLLLDEIYFGSCKAVLTPVRLGIFLKHYLDVRRLMKQYLNNISFFACLKFDQMKVDIELPICVTVSNVNFSDYGIFHLNIGKY